MIQGKRNIFEQAPIPFLFKKIGNNKFSVVGISPTQDDQTKFQVWAENLKPSFETDSFISSHHSGGKEIQNSEYAGTLGLYSSDYDTIITAAHIFENDQMLKIGDFEIDTITELDNDIAICSITKEQANKIELVGNTIERVGKVKLGAFCCFSNQIDYTCEINNFPVHTYGAESKYLQSDLGFIDELDIIIWNQSGAKNIKLPAKGDSGALWVSNPGNKNLGIHHGNSLVKRFDHLMDIITGYQDPSPTNCNYSQNINICITVKTPSFQRCIESELQNGICENGKEEIEEKPEK